MIMGRKGSPRRVRVLLLLRHPFSCVFSLQCTRTISKDQKVKECRGPEKEKVGPVGFTRCAAVQPAPARESGNSSIARAAPLLFFLFVFCLVHPAQWALKVCVLLLLLIVWFACLLAYLLVHFINLPCRSWRIWWSWRG